jgi:hypothetical protein
VTAQERLEKLERELLLLQQHTSTHAPERKDQVEFLGNSPDLKGISRSSAVMGILKGRGYGTHFYGASSAMSIVAQASLSHNTVSPVTMPKTRLLSLANYPSSLSCVRI